MPQESLRDFPLYPVSVREEVLGRLEVELIGVYDRGMVRFLVGAARPAISPRRRRCDTRHRLPRTAD